LKHFVVLPLIALSVCVRAQPEFKPLFDEKLSNAIFPVGIWTLQDGVLTASEDQAIWTSKVYQNFDLELEFMTAPGTNSGVIIYCSDIKNWIPNSVEVQIADDFAEQWATSAKSWQCGAIFGRLAPAKSAVKRPGEWNTYRISARDRIITVVLNGETVSTMDMRKWTQVKTNPDGSEIPSWLSTPAAMLPGYGHIGLQGKHAGAPIYFRNLRIKEL
jgi:hypothetical protein